MAGPGAPTGTTNTWLGRAKPRAQVQTVQVTAYHASTTYTLTINGKSVSTINNATVNATATALADAWNAATEAEFTAITASASTDTVTLTADTAGIPFVFTKSVSGGTGTMAAIATTYTATGPNHASDVNNWSVGVLPVDGDDVYIPGGTASILYDLDALAAIGPNSITVHARFGALGEVIGLPFRNPSGYTEYLTPRYLQWDGSTTCKVGTGNGRGSSQIFMDFGTGIVAFEGIQSQQSPDGVIPAVVIKTINAGSTVEISSGDYGIAFDSGDLSTITTVRNSNGTLRIGPGVTLTTLTTSGDTTAECATTTTTIKAGNCTLIGSGAHTTITVLTGQLNYNSSGTVTTMNIGGGTSQARVDCSGDISTRTWTTTNCGPLSEIYDPAQTITYTNKPAPTSAVSTISFS